MKWRSALLWLSALGVALMLTLAFQKAERARELQYGRYPAPADNTWRINLTVALDFTRYWYQQGYWKSGMLPRFRPPSVGEPHGGPHYFSYPPMFILVPLAVAHLSGQRPNIEMLTRIGSVGQLAMAVMATIFVFFAAQAAGTAPISALWLGGISGSLTLLVPASLIYFPFGWWADMVVLPIFAAMIATEAWAPRWKGSNLYRIFQASLAFAGVFSDWLFFLLLGALVLKDLTSRPRKIRWEFVAAPLMYALYHLNLVLSAGYWSEFTRKVLERTGVAHQSVPIATGLLSWREILLKGLGENGYWLYLATVAALPVLVGAFFLRHRCGEKARAWIELCFLVMIPMHLHSVILRQHHYHHTYNAVKFALLVSVVWFGLIPALASLVSSKRAVQLAAVALSFIGAITYARSFTPIYNNFFDQPLNLDPTLERRCRDVYSHNVPSDINFSPDFGTSDVLAKVRSVPKGLPISEWGVAACGQKVYLSLSPADFPGLYLAHRWYLRLIGATYHLRLWTVGPPSRIWDKYVVAGSGQKIGELEVHELSRNIFNHGN